MRARSTSHQWWSEDLEIRGAAPDLANSVIPVALGLATALISFLTLEILLIAVALGSANYATGIPDGVSGGQFRLLSLAVVAVSGGLGAAVAGIGLRRGDVERRGARKVAPLAPGLAGIAVAINGLTAGAGWTGCLFVLAAAALGIATGTWFGTRGGGRR
jgi:hypothetical protein